MLVRSSMQMVATSNNAWCKLVGWQVVWLVLGLVVVHCGASGRDYSRVLSSTFYKHHRLIRTHFKWFVYCSFVIKG